MQSLVRHLSPMNPRMLPSGLHSPAHNRVIFRSVRVGPWNGFRGRLMSCYDLLSIISECPEDVKAKVQGVRRVLGLAFWGLFGLPCGCIVSDTAD